MGKSLSCKAAERMLLFFCMLCALPLAAQENQSEVSQSEPATETYIVTATRTEEDAFTSATNTSVITAEEIASCGKSSLVEVLLGYAGIQLTSASGTNADAQVSMRGFGENAFGRVLIMVDGRRLNNADMSGVNLASVPLESIDRIEIVDGASSALYGDNAVGGVINIITKESSTPLEVSGAFSLGPNWTTNARFGVTASDPGSGFSLFIDNYNTKGWRERTATKTMNALLSGYADVTDMFTLRPSFYFSDNSMQLPGSLSQGEYESDRTKANYQDDDAERRSAGGGLSAEWNPIDSVSVVLPLDGEYKKAEYNTTSFGTFSTTEQKRANVRPVIRFKTQLGASGASLNLAAGYDFSAVFMTPTYYAEKARLTPTSGADITQYTNAPYLTAEVTFPHGIKVDGAVRYDMSSLSVTGKHGAVSGTQKYKALVYSGGFSASPLETFSIYARAGNLFRYPFVDEVASYSGWGSSFNPDLKPETGWNMEAGVKFRYGNYVSAKANVFYMPMKDEIWYNSATMQNENYNETLRTGFNADITITPFKYGSFTAGVSYVDAHFTAGTDKDKKVPLVSPLSVSASVNITPFAWLTLSPSLIYRSDYYAAGDTANEFDKQKGYILANLMMKMEYKNFLFTAVGNNLLDTKYSSYTGAYKNYYTNAPEYYYYPAEGRSYTLSLSYRKRF